MKVIEALKFNKEGLIPAIVQDVDTHKVLMLAYMNKTSLMKTMETKETWFFSRSRQKLWNKGETSGNKQEVESIVYDCDKDTLLLMVRQRGPACHTGETTCFFNKLMTNNFAAEDDLLAFSLESLYRRIQERKNLPKEGSYTSYLMEKGMDKILKKIGEEASEVIIGAKNDNQEEVIYEISDLVYHTLVLMAEMDIGLDDIREELYKRFKK